jgi:Flp pilus assembly protein TadD
MKPSIREQLSRLSILILGLVTLLLFAPSFAQVNAPKSRPINNAGTGVAAQQTTQGALNQLETQPQIIRRQLNSMVDPEVMRGYKALQLNQFSQAREAYSLVLGRNPTQRDALLGIAYAHYALGDTTQAISTLRQLVNLYPRDSDAISALFLIAGGDLQEQETRIKQMLERSERPAGLHYALGVIYFEQSRFGEAERAFDRAFSMDPEQPDYAYNLAITLDRLGRLREASRLYVAALNLANQTSSVFSRDIARNRLRVLTNATK